MKRTPLSYNDGFTLVEVLVAVVVLSIGLLAVAGMQATSLRGGNDALMRSQATLGCEDILDRMRSNRSAALSGGYDIAFSESVATQTGMVLTDLGEWKVALGQNLPSGDGSVVTTGNIITVTVLWVSSFGQDEVEMVTRL